MDYERLYYMLFGAMEDAVEALERLDIGTARAILIRAQRQAEERILESGESRDQKR